MMNILMYLLFIFVSCVIRICIYVYISSFTFTSNIRNLMTVIIFVVF